MIVILCVIYRVMMDNLEHPALLEHLYEYSLFTMLLVQLFFFRVNPEE